MSTTGRRRQNVRRSLGGKNKRVKVTQEELMEADQSILSPEIMEMIFKHLDFSRLKSCRLVCKSWNREICRLFKHDGVVGNLSVDVDSFKSSYRRASRRHKLPLPFENLSFDIVPEDAVIFKNACSKFPEMSVTKLTLSESNASLEEASDVLDLIQYCAPSLTHLKTQFWGTPPDFEFPSLRSLSIIQDEETDESPGDQAEFFKHIIAASPKLVELKVCGQPLATNLLAHANLLKIQKLALHMDPESIPSCVPEAMKTMQIDCLKMFKIRFDWFEESNVVHIYAVLARFAATLEQLKLIVHVKYWERLPLFPRLTHLDLRELCVGHLNFGKLPALKSITIGRVYVSEEPVDTSRLYPLGVRSVTVDQIDSAEKAREAFTLLFQQFPDATEWHIRDEKFVSEFCGVASALQKRITRMGCGGSCFGGMEKRDLTPDLLLLSDLKELDLHSKYTEMSDTVAKVNFDELNYLTTLRLFWETRSEKRLSKLAKKLKPVGRIILLVEDYTEWSDNEQLMNRIPSAAFQYPRDQFA